MPARLRRIARAAGVFLLLETGLRLQAWTSGSDPDQAGARLLREAPVAVRGDCATQAEQSTLGAVVRPSSIPDLGYELRPDLDTCLDEARVRTNEGGLRSSRPVPRATAPGTCRVALLGDSQAFGWGVDEPLSVAGQLEPALPQALGGPAEIVNLGVPGYNTAQQAAWLDAWGPSYAPDVVAIVFMPDDLGLPELTLRPRAALGGVSHVLALSLRFFAAGTRAPARDAWYDTTPRPESGSIPDVGSVPPAYRPLVGIAGYRRALARIAESAKRLGAAVVDFADLNRLKASEADIEGLAREHARLGIRLEPTAMPWGHEAWVKSHAAPFLNARGSAELARRMLPALAEACRVR